MGYNGFPMLVNDISDNYNDRDLKLNMILHAEVNAILFAEVPLSNCTIYTYPFPPCCRCAAQIIQSGIRKVIAPKPSESLVERWSIELDIATNMYKDAGVTLIEVD
jgi:dCMP deaminase